MGQLNAHIRAIVLLVGKAHRQEVAFPYLELEGAARKLKSASRFRLWRRFEDPAYRSADRLTGPGFQLRQERQEHELLGGKRQLERTERSCISGGRGG